MRTAQSLRRATESLRGKLDPIFMEHCTVARIGHERVVVVADTAVWASRMRYMIPQLREHFAQYLGVTGSLAVEIKVHSTPTLEQVSEARPLSESSRVTISETAQALPPGRLRDALERLASDPE